MLACRLRRFVNTSLLLLGLLPLAGLAATEADLERVQLKLQQAAAPWCERLSERHANGVKRCTIKLSTSRVPGFVNAMAGFGDVWITDELLPHLTEGDLALVMGHEFGHLVLGHALQRLRDLDASDPSRRALLTWLERSNVPPHEEVPTDAVQQELDADELGLYLAGLAGYPVRELASFWALRAQHLPKSTFKGFAAGRTHPPQAVRAEGLSRAADEFCERLAARQPLMPGKARLQPRYEFDVEDLRAQAVGLSLEAVCKKS